MRASRVVGMSVSINRLQRVDWGHLARVSFWFSDGHKFL
jgi:hypothetical protein